MNSIRVFLADDRGDTNAGFAVGAVLVLAVVLLVVVLNGGFAQQPQQPGVDINIRGGT